MACVAGVLKMGGALVRRQCNAKRMFIFNLFLCTVMLLRHGRKRGYRIPDSGYPNALS